MFIQNHSGGLVNTTHIITVGIDAPKFEQRDFIVSARLTYGTAILYRGTEAECKVYMKNLAAIIAAARCD